MAYDSNREVVRETTVVDDRPRAGAGPGAGLLVALLLILLLLAALWYFGLLNFTGTGTQATTAPGGGATAPAATAPAATAPASPAATASP
jgi:hypothetical protein